VAQIISNHLRHPCFLRLTVPVSDDDAETHADAARVDGLADTVTVVAADD